MPGNREDFDYPPEHIIVRDWYTTDQAAEIMGVVRKTVNILAARGRLTAYKFGTKQRGILYIYPQDAENYVRGTPGTKPKQESD